MKKILLSGLVSGLVILLVGMVLGFSMDYLLPAVKTEAMHSAALRTWGDHVMRLYFAYPFILGLAMAWAWNKVKGAVSGQSFWQKGINFGLSIWLIASVPGLWITYSSFRISLFITLTWLFVALFQLLSAGVVCSKMNT